MTSDEKRREVARKLREPKESLLAYPDDELIRLRRETGCPRGQDFYEHLADLIDRPTCHLIEDEDGYTACSECGCTALCMRDATYCPACGRVIVND